VWHGGIELAALNTPRAKTPLQFAGYDASVNRPSSKGVEAGRRRDGRRLPPTAARIRLPVGRRPRAAVVIGGTRLASRSPGELASPWAPPHRPEALAPSRQNGVPVVGPGAGSGNPGNAWLPRTEDRSERKAGNGWGAQTLKVLLLVGDAGGNRPDLPEEIAEANSRDCRFRPTTIPTINTKLAPAIQGARHRPQSGGGGRRPRCR